MTAYISNASEWPTAGISTRAGGRGNTWAHLVADSLTELHAFARTVGLKHRGFRAGRLPHYALTLHAWGEAHRLGATQVTRSRLLEIARTCGRTPGRITPLPPYLFSYLPCPPSSDQLLPTRRSARHPQPPPPLAALDRL